MQSNVEFESTEYFDDEYSGESVKRIKLEQEATYDDIIYEDSSSTIQNQYNPHSSSSPTIDSVCRDVQHLTNRVKRLENTVKTNHKIINNKLNIILDYLLKSSHQQQPLNIQQLITNDFIDEDFTADSSFIPKPIASRETFDDIEEKLKEFDCNPTQNQEFGLIRKQMVKYYAKRLSNVNTRTDPKNGLMHTLMLLYFDKEFIKTIGWTAVGIRWAIKDAKGHFQLFRDIVNMNSMNTYTNNDEASHALFIFLRRFHEKINKEAKNMTIKSELQ